MATTRRKAALTRTQRLASYLEKTLLPDLRGRAKEPSLADSLAARYAFEREHKRTAASLLEWTDQTLTQVAVAWVLSAVFVRTLEDRGLLARKRIAGGDAQDSERAFYEMFSNLGARDYLAAVFTEVSHAPVLTELLGPALNPAWKLSPSHDAVRALFELLRDADADGTLSMRFDDGDTRFLGDLYQDLSAEVRERFALLQTPDFVEAFILDRTLEPALQRFGLESFRVIDPTCGSGHFLLGSFHRLVEHLRRANPGAELRDLAARALDHVYGSDINPYAVAIARFRLLLAYVDLCGVSSIAEAPSLPSLAHNVVVADSLLLGAEGTKDLAELALDADSQSTWGPRAFDFADPPSVNHVFRQRFHAVVGNPPYIVCRDAALRELYRKGYPDSAQRQFALAAPFTQRFFKLAESEGFVGLINANSFMTRDFGRDLVEKVLPKLDLTQVIDTSGAYIPGHGTPTVILFGRNRVPKTETVRVAMGRRGEPETPSDPTKGKVWSSIADHDTQEGFENEFITIADLPRTTLSRHPWSLGGGGASVLKELIENKCQRTLSSMTEDFGCGAITKEDELFSMPPNASLRWGFAPEAVAFEATGEQLRDWGVSPANEIVFPYHRTGVLKESALGRYSRVFWQQRTLSWQRAGKGFKSIRELGYEHYQYGMFYWERYYAPFKIAWAFVATHNHFVLDRGGKVFRQSAPITKLPASATEDDHLALIGWLNSSSSCFWLKQISHDKGSGTDTGKWQAESAKIAFEFSGGAVEKIPVPTLDGTFRDRLLSLSRSIDALAQQRTKLVSDALPAESTRAITSPSAVRDLFAEAHAKDDALLRTMISLQEEIDWLSYQKLELCGDLSAESAGLDPLKLEGTPLGARPFEMLLARSGQAKGIDGQTLQPSPPESWSAAQRDLWERRAKAIDGSSMLKVVEVPDYKRRWLVTPKDLAGRVWTFDDEVQRYVRGWLLDRVEAAVSRVSAEQVASLQEIDAALHGDATFLAVLEFSLGIEGADLTRAIGALLEEESVAFLAAQRHTETGLEKRALWERTWDLQRREDAGESVGEIPVPPKYDREDWRETRYWSLRGKLDVPRERFIAYPGAALDAKAPLYGWAGWNHLERARALAALYQQRKTSDGWDRDRLRPLLAGLQELLPWLLQWHNEPDPELDGLRQGAVWAEFLEGERATLGWSEEELRAWRPAAPVRGGGAGAKRATKAKKGAKGAEGE